MKDCIDRWLEKNTVLFSPVEARMTTEVKLANPVKKEMTDQERWDKAMREMGWTHLVGNIGKNKAYLTQKAIFFYCQRCCKASFSHITSDHLLTCEHCGTEQLPF